MTVAIQEELESKKKVKRPKTAEALWQVPQYFWNNLPAGFLIKLQDSVLKRIDAVLKDEGGHNK